MAAGIRKFGTDLLNRQDEILNRKRNEITNCQSSKSFEDFEERSKESTLDFETNQIKYLNESISQENKIPIEVKQTLEESERRFCYAKDFLLSFQNKCTEPLEGIPNEIRRDALPFRSNRFFKQSRSNPNSPCPSKHSRPQAHTSSLLSILASPSGGVVYAPTTEGRYQISEKKKDILKNLKSLTTVILPVPLTSKKEINNSVDYEIPQKNSKLKVESDNASPTFEDFDNSHSDACDSPKLITLEWQPKRVKKVKPRETDVKRLASRQKQIDIGMNTPGYKEFLSQKSKGLISKTEPKIPDKFQICSKRSWDGQIRKWRRQLHEYDPPGLEIDEKSFGLEDDLDEEVHIEEINKPKGHDYISQNSKLVVKLEELFVRDSSLLVQ